MKKFISNNIGLKLLSVLLALLLWFSVMNIEDPTVTKTISDIPVTIVNDDVIRSRGYGYIIESGEKIDIRVKGRRSYVDSIDADDFVATADFNSFSSMKMVPIEVICKYEHESDLEWAAKTDSMAIILESELTESKSIRIETVGGVKEGYSLYSLTTNTSLVSVKGAQSQIEKVKEIVAEVSVEGLKDSEDLEVPLYAVDEEGQKIDAKKVTLEPETITAHLVIHPIKAIPLAVRAEGRPLEYYYLGEIEYAPKEIELTADEETLNRLEVITIPIDISGASEDVEKQIDLEEYIEDTYPVEGIKLVDKTKTMGIKIQIIAMMEQILDVKEDHITIRGADREQFRYILTLGEQSRLRVRGKAEEMLNIEPNDFDLYIDVTGLTQPNKYPLNLMTEYEGGLILELGQVDVTIEKILSEPQDQGGDQQPNDQTTPDQGNSNAE